MQSWLFVVGDKKSPNAVITGRDDRLLLRPPANSPKIPDTVEMELQKKSEQKE